MPWKLGLNLQNIIGQCYDGAASMSGIYRDVSSRLKSKNKIVHCYAHKFNLRLKSACCLIPEVRNCIGTVNVIFNLIKGSPKRHQIFQKIQSECGETKWSSRDRQFLKLLKYLSSI